MKILMWVCHFPPPQNLDFFSLTAVFQWVDHWKLYYSRTNIMEMWHVQKVHLNLLHLKNVRTSMAFPTAQNLVFYYSLPVLLLYLLGLVTKSYTTVKPIAWRDVACAERWPKIFSFASSEKHQKMSNEFLKSYFSMPCNSILTLCYHIFVGAIKGNVTSRLISWRPLCHWPLCMITWNRKTPSIQLMQSKVPIERLLRD